MCPEGSEPPLPETGEKPCNLASRSAFAHSPSNRGRDQARLDRGEVQPGMRLSGKKHSPVRVIAIPPAPVTSPNRRGQLGRSGRAVPDDGAGARQQPARSRVVGRRANRPCRKSVHTRELRVHPVNPMAPNTSIGRLAPKGAGDEVPFRAVPAFSRHLATHVFSSVYLLLRHFRLVSDPLTLRIFFA